jgi:hypothetical protein
MVSRGGRIVAAILVFALSLAIAGIGGCNLHELGHLATGRALGVPVDSITWCTPANGRIAFSYQEPAFVSYAGGFTAALVLGAVYRLLIWPRIASPLWRAAGVGVLGTAVSQVIVGVLEGSSPQGYARAQESALGLVLLVGLPLVGAAVIQPRLRRSARPDA